MRFPQRAYLECEDIGPCMFSSERNLRIKMQNGKNLDGFFDSRNIEEGLGLKVTALAESGDSTKVALPQNETYGEEQRADAQYWVRKRDVTYEEELERPN